MDRKVACASVLLDRQHILWSNQSWMCGGQGLIFPTHLGLAIVFMKNLESLK